MMSWQMWRRVISSFGFRERFGWLMTCALLLGCEPGGPSVETVDRAQPGATVLPLETVEPGGPDAGVASLRDGGLGADAAPPPPEPFEAYAPAPADRLSARAELSGVRMAMQLKRLGSGPWPAPPENAAEAIRKLREETTTALRVELAAMGRMRVELTSRGQPLPKGTAIAARFDKYGSVLLWPGASRYRLLPPGTLRSALADRRADVAPLAKGKVLPRGVGARLDRKTRLLSVKSPVAEIELELASMAEGGLGAPLLCRFALEMAGIDPRSPACDEPGLLLRATIIWSKDEARAGGTVELVATELLVVENLTAGRVTTTPPRAAYVASGLPGSTTRKFLTNSEFEKLLGVPADAPVELPKGAPKEGLVAYNASDRLLLLEVDGLPVASVGPWATIAIPELPAGNHTAQWHSFLGQEAYDSEALQVPARLVFGSPPGEKPDAG